MASVEIIRCSGCGANLSPSELTCCYCHSKNVIITEENPFNLDQDLTQKYIDHFQSRKQNIVKNAKNLFSLGLFYMNLKLYDLATKNFYSAAELNPKEPEIYYYLALSLIKGRRPMSLMLNEIKEIEKYINTSIRLGDKSKYYYLAAVINYDYYFKNGMKIPRPNYEELINSALYSFSEPLENKVILDNVIIRDERLINILNYK